MLISTWVHENGDHGGPRKSNRCNSGRDGLHYPSIMCKHEPIESSDEFPHKARDITRAWVLLNYRRICGVRKTLSKSFEKEISNL